MSKKNDYIIANPRGVHIKPLTIVVNEANRFESNCTLVYNDCMVNLKSIMGTLALEIPANAKFTILIDGRDEDVASSALTKVLQEQELI